MTFFHFVNCVALAYIPYMIVYKCSGLAEYSAFWKCLQAGGAYLFTQLCKMLLLATFVPPSEAPSGGMDLMGDLLKTTVEAADLVGLHLVMTRVAGKGQLKFMVASMGWASADLLMTRIFPLWVGARGVEFDWKYIQMSFDSNVSLVHHITLAMLVWLYSRSDLHKSYLPVVVVLLALGIYRPLVVELVTRGLGLGSWTLLLARAGFTLTMGLAALHLYLALPSHSLNSYY